MQPKATYNIDQTRLAEMKSVEINIDSVTEALVPRKVGRFLCQESWNKRL